MLAKAGRKLRPLLLIGCISVILLFILFVTSIGCPTREFDLSISEYPPRFRLSHKIWPRGLPLNFDKIVVTEVDSKTKVNRTLWSIVKLSGDKREIFNLTYGEAPEGWRAVVQAQPIRNDTTYCFEGKYYFRRSSAGEYRILTDTQFAIPMVRARQGF